jgi:serine phosphatase RsbU (regulator of sigma subunit)
MMSMVANSMFKEVFENKKISSPAKILQALDCELEKTINKNQDEKFNDGMDVALISINKATNELMFSGAFRSILIVRESEIIELKGNRYPIGYYSGIEKEFTNEFFQLKKDDQIYLYTDGYNDQFGGEKNKKLNKANFKELLLTINLMHMEEQEAFLEYAFNNWKQNEEQTDDILIVGIKI